MIGIFGGTFDPIHSGHLRIALDAQEQLRLSEVRFIPLHQAVHREQPIASPEQRLAMLEAATQDQMYLKIDQRELNRKGSSFMVDTLDSLAQELPKQSLCLLLGSDAFNGFMQWKMPQKILTLANILVMQRPGYQLPNEPMLKALVDKHQCELAELKNTKSGAVGFHNVTQLEISSSDIRQRIQRGNSLDYLVPRAVINYIAAENLYAN